MRDVKTNCLKCKEENWSPWRIEYFDKLGGPARVRECLTCGCGQLKGAIRNPEFANAVNNLEEELEK